MRGSIPFVVRRRWHAGVLILLLAATPASAADAVTAGELIVEPPTLLSLGFEFDPRFTDQNAACMVLSSEGYVMLLRDEFFRTFTDKAPCDTAKSTAVRALTTLLPVAIFTFLLDGPPLSRAGPDRMNV